MADGNAFKKALADTKEISITVKGRKTGKQLTLPIWFGLDGNTLYLLPAKGSATQWFKNLQTSRSITLTAGNQKFSGKFTASKEKETVQKVVGLIRNGYGEKGLTYYSNSDVAVIVGLN